MTQAPIFSMVFAALPKVERGRGSNAEAFAASAFFLFTSLLAVFRSWYVDISTLALQPAGAMPV
jgi:hypothetical protein